jgi:hypothetical protein
MLRIRNGFEVLMAGFMFAFLLLIPACAGENASTDDPPPVELAMVIPETEAGAALGAALAEAGRTDRHVFLHTGADW